MCKEACEEDRVNVQVFLKAAMEAFTTRMSVEIMESIDEVAYGFLLRRI